jgi:hypothetical protein
VKSPLIVRLPVLLKLPLFAILMLRTVAPTEECDKLPLFIIVEAVSPTMGPFSCILPVAVFTSVVDDKLSNPV